MMFDKFTSRVIIRGSVEASTGLHVGAGNTSLDPSATDSPVIRDAAGRPFIPGSSLKGALRSHLEKIVLGLGRDSVRACDPLANPCISKKDFESIEKEAKKASKGNGQDDRAQYDALVADAIDTKSCDVCKIFGSNYLAAHAMVRDLFIDPQLNTVRVELRDGVGIDRDTETARQHVKYDFEVIPASTRFILEVAVENGDAESLGLLGIGLREMEQGRVSLGGKTTRGLGKVILEFDEIEVAGDGEARDLDGEGYVDLPDYFIKGSGKKLKGTALREYLNRKIGAFATARLGR
jgi:CRISPR-associated protein Csm3